VQITGVNLPSIDGRSVRSTKRGTLSNHHLATRVGRAPHGYSDTSWLPHPGLLDIIANKFLRLPAVNSKIVQSTGDLHHKIVLLFFRISKNVFDNATSFDPSNDMLNHNPD